MGESNPPASSMKLEARTPVLALKETAKQHAADGDAELAGFRDRQRAVGAAQAAHIPTCHRSELTRTPRITCQLHVQGAQLPRAVEGLHEGIKCYLGVCQW